MRVLLERGRARRRVVLRNRVEDGMDLSECDMSDWV